MTDVEREIEHRRNSVAAGVLAGCGFVPLSVRYQAADAALAVVAEWEAQQPITGGFGSWLETAVRRAEMGRGDFTEQELEALRGTLSGEPAVPWHQDHSGEWHQGDNDVCPSCGKLIGPDQDWVKRGAILRHLPCDRAVNPRCTPSP